MRDGSGVYHVPPGTEGEPNTTIESAKYNNFLADLTTDLNAPRPLIAGGTGATSADTALAALSAEKAGQVITNFDSHTYVSGSFTSDPSATAAPVAGHAFIGTVYLGSSANTVVVEARDTTDAFSPGLLYTRQKIAGLWGPWVKERDDRYVELTGDTMTGPLTVAAIANASHTFTASGTPGNYQATYTLDGTGLKIGHNSSARTLELQTANTTRLTIAGTGAVTVANTITSAQSSTQGTYFFGSGGTRYLNYDGTNFNLVGANLFTNTINASAPATGSCITFRDSGSGMQRYVRVNSAAGLEFVNNAFSGVVATLSDTGNWQMFGALTIQYGGAGTVSLNCAAQIGYAGGGIQFGMAFRPQADTTTQIIFSNAAGTTVGSITETATATAFNTSSDGRLKTDLKQFDAGPLLDEINAYDFEWRRAGTRAHGVVAQEVARIFPEAVNHDIESDVWQVDYSKFVPLLLQEIKALRRRVEALER